MLGYVPSVSVGLLVSVVWLRPLKNIMQSNLSLDALKHVIISISKLSSFLQFRHISS